MSSTVRCRETVDLKLDPRSSYVLATDSETVRNKGNATTFAPTPTDHGAPCPLLAGLLARSYTHTAPPHFVDSFLFSLFTPARSL